ncbi:hypothetical protein BKA67DRAFT_643507 [Truncatella angustata]|uniref:DUF7702 domain-containing protein n=1 Tax=Truncatella angustata TaxID=152316 RepID=A0A9P8ZZQ4_9PEZI|nr:uncharacterized protein BKA67DRAFT_643507 [Truncatella angustata]KAH6657512.1 hypothetical protein BKA67DRAFT_643507 [Truncatella angustata]KAH8197860.1 hypothetical protein TruAng_007959 [Truncatella angustata]
MTNAGSLACLSLAIIGILYEVNIMLPYPRRWTEKSILGITHLTNTAGIALATYGGSPSATAAGGVAAQNLNQIGNCLMLFVIFVMCWWIWPTWKRSSALGPNHPITRPARLMIFSAAAAIPFQLVRLAYNTTYAFDHLPLLDPIMGSFAVRLILLFFMQLGVSLALIAGGWSSMPPHTKFVVAEDMTELQQFQSSTVLAA